MGSSIRPSTVFLIFALASVTAQTFQYSRGWVNGKRDGQPRKDQEKLAINIEHLLGPCQLDKLKYLLEGKPLSERAFSPCDYNDEEIENQPKTYTNDRNGQDAQFDAFL